MNTTLSDSFHIILVEPANSLNIGAVARAMMNLGFRHLHLVAPSNYDRSIADVTARRADPVLDNARFHETFAGAIGDMEEVIGLALRPGNAPHFIPLPEWAGALPARLPRRIGLVFGPENNGLRDEHLAHCRWVVRIPAAEDFPEFNLAQSVLLVLYEITRTLPAAQPGPTEDADLPDGNDFLQLDRRLGSLMTASGFTRPGMPPRGPGIVRNLFRRLDLTAFEMRVVLALFSRLETTLARSGKPAAKDCQG